MALRFARWTVSLRCPTSTRPTRKVCDPLLQTCARLVHAAGSCQVGAAAAVRGGRRDGAGRRSGRWARRGRPRALGRPVDRQHRDREGHPRPAPLAAQRGAWRSRRARRASGRGRRRATRHPARATASTRRCSPTPTSTPSTSRCPTTSTRAWTIAAARAGKHVLCEKPLAMTADEAQAMVDACRDAGVLLMEAFMYRHHPSWVAVRELVASGRIGRLQAVDSWFSYFNDDPANIRNIREAGGGALYDIGCYSVNLSRMLFGAEPVGVQAAITARPGLGVDVLTSGILEFDDGHRDVHLLDPDGDRPAGPHLRHARAGSRSRSRSTSRPTARRRIFVTAGGDPPVAPATETLTFETADPYACEAERVRRRRPRRRPAAGRARGRRRQPAGHRGAVRRGRLTPAAAYHRAAPAVRRGVVGPRLPSARHVEPRPSRPAWVVISALAVAPRWSSPLVGVVAVARVAGASSDPAARSAPPRFVDETATAGLDHTYDGGDDTFDVGGGVAVFDCDGDGRPDVYVAGGARPGGAVPQREPDRRRACGSRGSRAR